MLAGTANQKAMWSQSLSAFLVEFENLSYEPGHMQLATSFTLLLCNEEAACHWPGYCSHLQRKDSLKPEPLDLKFQPRCVHP